MTSRTEPAWAPHPGLEITFRPAVSGEVRTGRNGAQWYLDPAHGWRPVVHKPDPEHEREHEHEAGA
jgi:hypothetical protein